MSWQFNENKQNGGIAFRNWNCALVRPIVRDSCTFSQRSHHKEHRYQTIIAFYFTLLEKYWKILKSERSAPFQLSLKCNFRTKNCATREPTLNWLHRNFSTFLIYLLQPYSQSHWLLSYRPFPAERKNVYGEPLYRTTSRPCSVWQQAIQQLCE